MNLFFHASRTGDPVAISLLEELTGLQARESPGDVAHLLSNYEAGEDGWSFEIDLPEAGWVLFPMSHYEGTRVFANGEKVDSVGIERLILARMPAGVSSVQIRSERTGIYTAGNIATLLGILLLAAVLTGAGPGRVAGFTRRSTAKGRALIGKPLPSDDSGTQTVTSLGNGEIGGEDPVTQT